MSNQHRGWSGPPEPPESYETHEAYEDYEDYDEELVDELDSDLEPENDDLRPLWQPVYEANQQSLERVYARLRSIESTRLPASPAATSSGQSSATPASEVRGAPTVNAIKTVPAPSIVSSSPSRGRPFAPSRLTTIAAVLATGFLLTGTLLGFLYFRGARPAQPGPAPQLTATLRCQSAPFVDESDGLIVFNGAYNTYSQNPLDWSAPDAIAFANPPTLIWNPLTCRTAASQSPIQAAMNSKTIGAWGGQIVLSPDGKRVFVIGGAGWVLDAQTGRILTKLQMSGNAGIISGYGQAVWTDGGSQIVAVTVSQVYRNRQYTFTYKVQVWDSHSGAFIRTAITFRHSLSGARQVWISPDASHAVMLLANHSLQFWDIATGQVISTTPSIANGAGGTVAWSPDGNYLAFGINSANPSVIPGQTQIWSSQTGQLVITLPDTNTLKGLIGALSWSPNGQYLAESSGQITIWNTANWQQAAVFDTVATSTELGHGITQYKLVVTLAWSPGSRELASATFSYTYPLPGRPSLTNDELRLSVWKLTPVSAPTPLPTLAPLATATATVVPPGAPTETPTGPSLVIVPNVAGQSCFEATQNLNQLGLQANCIAQTDPHDPTYPAGEAYASSPPAGTQVAANTTVDVFVSQLLATPTATLSR